MHEKTISFPVFMFLYLYIELKNKERKIRRFFFLTVLRISNRSSACCRSSRSTKLTLLNFLATKTVSLHWLHDCLMVVILLYDLMHSVNEHDVMNLTSFFDGF